MTRSEEVIEKTKALIAASRAFRERDAERRKKVFGRIEIGRPLPPLRKGGVQLEFKLN